MLLAAWIGIAGAFVGQKYSTIFRRMVKMVTYSPDSVKIRDKMNEVFAVKKDGEDGSKDKQPKPAQATVKKSSELTKADIIEEVNAAVRQVEQKKTAFRVNEIRNATLQMKECSVEGLKPILENIVQSFAGEKETIYNFDGGVATDGTGNTVCVPDVLPPKYASFAAAIYSVEDATRSSVKNGLKYTLLIGAENVKTDGVPFDHACTTGYIDLTKLDFSPFVPESSEVSYGETTLTVMTDKKGTLLSLSCCIPVELKLRGNAGLPVELTVKGTVEYSVRVESGE